MAGDDRDAAKQAGHEVRTIEVARMSFPLLRSKAEWDTRPVPPEIAAAQVDLEWSNHWAVFFPLWLGGMPAML